MRRVRTFLFFAAAGAVALGAGCATEAPTDPDGLPSADAAGRPPGAVAHQPNNRPQIVVKTQPPLNDSESPPFVIGEAPFTVNFNLCESFDPDVKVPDSQPTAGEGDTLNWEFHWGDGDRPPFDESGRFQPDFWGRCREPHEYRAGIFLATLAVTDLHLEDQSGDVRAAAREFAFVQIRSVGLPVGNTSNSIEAVRTPS